MSIWVGTIRDEEEETINPLSQTLLAILYYLS
jgi:hypothetical protein